MTILVVTLQYIFFDILKRKLYFLLTTIHIKNNFDLYSHQLYTLTTIRGPCKIHNVSKFKWQHGNMVTW